MLRVLHGHELPVFGVAMDQNFIVTTTGRYTRSGKLAGPGSVRIWRAHDFKLLHMISGDRAKNVLSQIVLFGDHVLTASKNKTLELIEVSTQRTVETIALPFQVRGIAMDGENRIAVCGTDVEALVFPSPFFIHAADGARDMPMSTSPGRQLCTVPRVLYVFLNTGAEPSSVSPVMPPNGKRSRASLSLKDDDEVE